MAKKKRSKAALAKDRKYFNPAQKHEVDYAKQTGRKKKRYKHHLADGGTAEPTIIRTQFEEEEFEYKDGGKIKEIETEIAEYQELIDSKAPSITAEQKDFAREEIAELKAKLEKLKAEPKKPVAKPAPVKKPAAPVKKAPAKKVAVKKPSAPSKKIDNEPSCDKLLEAWVARRASAKKAAKKHKTVSVSERIGTDVAHVVGKIIDNIPKADIKDSPKAYITKFEKIETATKAFLDSLKSLLGEDFDRKELIDPFEKTIGEFIKNVKEKYVK